MIVFLELANGAFLRREIELRWGWLGKEFVEHFMASPRSYFTVSFDLKGVVKRGDKLSYFYKQRGKRKWPV